MFTMYDTTTIDAVPNQPHAVAAYINGKYANYEEAKKRFPHSRLLGISVEGMVPADCYDVELGNYSPDEVVGLYRTAHEAGIWRPCFYAQLSGVMPAVIEALNDASEIVKQRSDVRLWVAYYNGSMDIPHLYDAHQFTDKALGRNLDESVCVDTFFQPAPAMAPKPSHPLAQARVTYDVDTDSWNILK